MPVDVTMPKLSDTMEEGKILKWIKHPGDKVAIGDVIAEVETDKANMELEAYDEGVLSEVRVQEGQSAPVGAVIAVLGDGGATAKAPEPKAAPKPAGEPAPKPEAAPPKPEPRRPTLVRKDTTAEADVEHVKASPLARKIAREHGLDLRGIAGTGPGGRIVEKDVEQALGGKRAPEARPEPSSRSITVPASGRVERSRIRRTTAQRMGEAKRAIPH